MFIVIGIMFAGIGTGFLLRNRKLPGLSQLTMGLIWLLLFLLGLEVGHNETLIRNLHALGLEALLLAIAGVLGSVIAARLLWVYLYRRKGAKR